MTDLKVDFWSFKEGVRLLRGLGRTPDQRREQKNTCCCPGGVKLATGNWKSIERGRLPHHWLVSKPLQHQGSHPGKFSLLFAA